MFKAYIDYGKRTISYLKKYREIARKVKKIVKNRHKDAKVYVFGSVLKGRITASSDIDILIVCNINPTEAAKLKAEIIRKTGLDTPLQIHIATHQEYQNWYKKQIDQIEEV